jgi:UDP-N-acetylmuramoyl-tripeptide--D-alanyl-D-alanine ligase
VIEIGANHPGEVAALVAIARPTVGLVTNAGAEHLEGFGDLDGVARAEGEMFAGLESGATAVINADDAYATLWRSMNRAARSVTFGLGKPADFSMQVRREYIDAGAFVQDLTLRTPAGTAEVRLALAGRHNASNALAAAAATSCAGASLDAIVLGLGRAQPVKGRLQPKAAHGGAWLIDDSYNANPSSVRAGLDVLAGLDGERWLVLGDMGELGEHAVAAHTEAGNYARERGVTRLFAVGQLTPHAVRAFGAGATSYADHAALVAALRPALHAGVNVLVKGSRSNRLERVVEALLAAPPTAQAG